LLCSLTCFDFAPEAEKFNEIPSHLDNCLYAESLINRV